jgi:transposase-like protein DUF772
LKPGVTVEKVRQLMLVAVQGSGYKQARVADAGAHRYLWRPATDDGKPLTLGIAVLLLPPRRSGSGKSSAASDRSLHQLRFYSRQVEGLLQRHRQTIDRPELLLRMLLVGYLYGVTSERKLVEELRMHQAWRWFTGLGFGSDGLAP